MARRLKGLGLIRASEQQWLLTDVGHLKLSDIGPAPWLNGAIRLECTGYRRNKPTVVRKGQQMLTGHPWSL